MTVSIIAVLASIIYLMGGQFTETSRLNHKQNQIRLPVCALIYTYLARPLSFYTPAQLSERPNVLYAYGKDGLRCPKSLPNTVP